LITDGARLRPLDLIHSIKVEDIFLFLLFATPRAERFQSLDAVP